MPAKILIAGAGIGGLAAALACLKRGFDVEVYEQAAELKEVGAGLQLSANGNRALYELGVGEALRLLSCEATGKEVRLWNTGDTWKLFDLGAVSVERYGYPYFTVYRPDLLAVLAAAVRALKADAIRLGARCTGFTQDAAGVRLELEGVDAASAPRGDVLIGADGVHSRIRQGLFGTDAPQFTGLMAWRGVIPMERLPERMRRLVGTNWIGPGGHIVHYPLRGGRLMNFVGVRERDDWRVESWSVAGSGDECLADFAGWHHDIALMIRAIDVPYKWALMHRPPLPRWSVGRVSLLGDACHSTLPFLAQGAVMAIEDGFILARALAATGDVPSALARYEAARRERTTRMVEGAAANTRRFHNPELAHVDGARAYVDREWNEARVRERYEWLFTYDVTSVPV
ncbi:MAG: FAD-dependent monooxygenase [Burkholderiales bacterium]|nr:FAD-dependent monooxygenase [Burkholderiales bacterium]